MLYNPRSSRFRDVRVEVLDKVMNPDFLRDAGLTGVMVMKYEVEPTDVDDNAGKLAKILRDGDMVLAVGGDATGVIGVNAIMQVTADARLAVLPYGNYNDLARTLGTRTVEEVLVGKMGELWPLEILVDGEHFRYATCYMTMGMTAEAVEIFDDKKIRKELQKGHKSPWRSYFPLMKWYFRNRKKKRFIPRFKLNGVEMDRRISDYAVVNGRTMATVMKGGEWFLDTKKFRRETGKLANLWNLGVLMVRSVFFRVPGVEVERDLIEFLEAGEVELQAEGEYRRFRGVGTVEIRKAEKSLKVIMR